MEQPAYSIWIAWTKDPSTMSEKWNRYLWPQKQDLYNIVLILQLTSSRTSWRNGSASDSRSEGCVFESRRGHSCFFGVYLHFYCFCFSLSHYSVCKMYESDSCLIAANLLHSIIYQYSARFMHLCAYLIRTIHFKLLNIPSLIGIIISLSAPTCSLWSYFQNIHCRLSPWPPPHPWAVLAKLHFITCQVQIHF